MHSSPAVPQPQRSERLPKRGGWDLLLILTGALLLVSQARVHVFIPGASAIRPGLLLLGAGLLVWFTKSKPLKRLGPPWPVELKLALFIFVWAGVGVPFALWAGQSASTLINILAPTLLVFLLVAASVRDLVDVRRLLVVMGVGGAVFAIMAPIQGRVEIRGFGAGGYDPNDSAMFLVSMLPVLIFFAVSARRIWWRVAAGVAGFLAIGAIVSTQSRGGFLALAAVLLFMLLFYRGIGIFAKSAAVAILVLGLVATADGEYWDRMETITAMDDGYSDGDVGGRVQIWTRGIGYIAENPLTGVGLYNFPVAEGQHEMIAERIRRGLGTQYSAAHSTWIQIGAELGIPGLLAFLGMFGSIAWKMWLLSRRKGRWRRTSRETALMASTILGVLTGLAVAGTFLSNAYWSMVWAPLALGMMLYVREKEARDMRRHSRMASGEAIPHQVPTLR